MSDSLKEQPFMSHLLELRDRLLRMVLAVLVLLLILFPFGNDIFTMLAQPVHDALPEGTSMLATKVLSPFLTPLKLAFVAAVFLAMPYLLYQLWGFIAPGLYAHEKRLAFPMLASSILLFYLGAAFAYFVVLPLLFPFLVGVVPQNVEVAPDIADFLDVAIKLFFAFGLAFEVPIATILLVMTGMTTPETLAQKRPYIIVGAFVVGMLLTPPDIISQTLLAVPVWLLFELGVFLSRLFVRRKAQREARAEAGVAATAAAGAAAVDPAAAYEGEHDEDGDWTPVKVEVPDDYRPLTEEEMERELDAIDAEEEDYEAQFDYEQEARALAEKQKAADAADSAAAGDAAAEDTQEDRDAQSAGDASPPPAEEPPAFVPDAVDAKLEQVMDLRNEERYDEARTLLYEVLVEGSDQQVKVARNILAQLDS
jgi:sec-independent protein translocase protein TatC